MKTRKDHTLKIAHNRIREKKIIIKLTITDQTFLILNPLSPSEIS